MANREMFQRIHGLLVEFPELHNQNRWEGLPEQTGSCGTTRCVAGWAVWLKAVELGLVSRKRETTRTDVLREVARHYSIEYGDMEWTYERLGAAILDLDSSEAASLFYDMHESRVTARVEAYAETGEDISDEEYGSF